MDGGMHFICNGYKPSNKVQEEEEQEHSSPHDGGNAPLHCLANSQ